MADTASEQDQGQGTGPLEGLFHVYTDLKFGSHQGEWGSAKRVDGEGEEYSLRPDFHPPTSLSAPMITQHRGTGPPDHPPPSRQSHLPNRGLLSTGCSVAPPLAKKRVSSFVVGGTDITASGSSSTGGVGRRQVPPAKLPSNPKIADTNSENKFDS